MVTNDYFGNEIRAGYRVRRIAQKPVFMHNKVFVVEEVVNKMIKLVGFTGMFYNPENFVRKNIIIKEIL